MSGREGRVRIRTSNIVSAPPNPKLFNCYFWAGTKSSSASHRPSEGRHQRYPVISNAVQGDLPLPWYHDHRRPTHLDLRGIPKSHSQTTLGSPNLVSGWHFLRTARARRRVDPVAISLSGSGREGPRRVPSTTRDQRTPAETAAASRFRLATSVFGNNDSGLGEIFLVIWSRGNTNGLRPLPSSQRLRRRSGPPVGRRVSPPPRGNLVGRESHESVRRLRDYAVSGSPPPFARRQVMSHVLAILKAFIAC